MADRRPLVNVAGQTQEMPSGDKVPIAALATGTPDGTKFIRDDGTLAVPSAGSGATLGTPVATTSGTSIDFTSLPSGIKRITVILSGVSTNGTSNLLVQIGSGSLTTSGYSSVAVIHSVATVTSTAGFVIFSGSAAYLVRGHIVITKENSGVYIASGITYDGTYVSNQVGSISGLSGDIDRLRLTTVNGTDTFDAGSVNVLYE